MVITHTYIHTRSINYPTDTENRGETTDPETVSRPQGSEEKRHWDNIMTTESRHKVRSSSFFYPPSISSTDLRHLKLTTLI